GDRRVRLRCGRRVAEEGVHRLRELDLEELPVASAVEAPESLRRAGHLVQEAAEELCVLPLLEEEGREEELLLEPALAGDREDEWQQLERPRLLAGDEQRRRLQERLALVVRERLPVGAVV